MIARRTPLLALALVVASTNSAAAYEPSRLAVELVAAQDEVPGHVCVLHDLGNPDEAVDLPPVISRPDTQHAGVALVHKAPDDPWYFIEAGTEASPLTAATPAELALRALSIRPAAQVSICGDETCAPRFELPNLDLRMTCATNAAGDPRQVLLLRLRLPGDREGEVDSMSLDGNLIAINGSWGTHRPTLQVLGGHYIAGAAASARVDDRMQLQIQTRCVRRQLLLPPIVRSLRIDDRRAVEPVLEIEPSGRELPFAGPRPAACRRPLCTQAHGPECAMNTVPILLQRGQESQRVTAALHLPALSNARDDHGFDIWLEARWADDPIPNPLPLRHYGVRFALRARCEFALDVSDPEQQECYAAGDGSFDRPVDNAVGACPRADLVEAGIVCKPGRFVEPREQCIYECEGLPGTAAFALPITARFALGTQEDAWRERLSQIDQTLSGFTPEATRQFSLQPSDEAYWGRDGGDQLATLKVWTPSGLKYEFNVAPRPDQWPTLTIPGGRCGSPLNYQYTGTRRFEEGVTKICNGRVYIPAPSKTAVRWTWGLLVAPVLIGTWLNDPDVTQPPWNFGLSAKLASRFHPTITDWGHGFSFELAASVLLSRRPYYALDVPDSAAIPRASFSYAWHIGLELAVMRTMAPRASLRDGWGIGALVAGGVRLPVKDTDKPLLGGQSFFFAVGPFVRAPAGGPIWLEFSVQYFPPLESVRVFRSADLRGPPQVEQYGGHTLMFAAGARFWL